MPVEEVVVGTTMTRGVPRRCDEVRTPEDLGRKLRWQPYTIRRPALRSPASPLQEECPRSACTLPLAGEAPTLPVESLFMTDPSIGCFRCRAGRRSPHAGTRVSRFSASEGEADPDREIAREPMAPVVSCHE